MEIGEDYSFPSNFHKEVLDNGIRVLTESIPTSPSVAIGVWVLVGSRVEREEESGVAHFTEHLCFKGTEKRTAFDIAREIDGIGGVLNGFTSQELTSFYVKVLPEHIDLALDLLSDLVIHPIFDPGELEREREVVLREIKMVEDNPDELVHDIFFELLFPQDPLGRPVSGREAVIAAVSREELVDFWQRYYTPTRIILAAAGRIKVEKFRNQVLKYFSGFKPANPSTRPAQIHFPGKSPLPIRSISKSLEEAYLCLGIRGYSVNHPRRYAIQVLNTYLGGGMSSRLFQEIREKRGLAYSVYSFTTAFFDIGVLGINLSTSPLAVRECLGLIEREITRLKAGEISSGDVDRVKEQIRGNLLLSLESSDGRMARLARGEIYFGRPIPIEEILEGFDRVTVEEVREVACDIFRPQAFSLAALGKLDHQGLFIPLGGS